MADIKTLDECREKLFKALHPEEAQYIESYYQPKEHHFCRAYTWTYSNLSVHTTQRGESYYVVVKAYLTAHTPISQAVQTIVEQTKELGRRYDAEINQQRRTTPRILDNAAFSAVKRKLTHYALELVVPEWSATKRMADDIEDRKEEEFEFDPNIGCTLGCELPARYSLPCKHWMYMSLVEDCPIPLSLFHPR
jgi:hypothetical protein